MLKKKNNLKAVSVLENAINNRIKELNDLKPILEFETNNYVAIKDDYDKNSLYFKNRAIIVGIRNCIAHGNYSVHCGKTILESKIIFNDIYEGKRTFQMGLALNEFMNLIENNFINVLNFVIDKKNYIENVKSK